MTTARKRIGAVLMVIGMAIMFSLSCMCTVASAKTKGTLTLVCECRDKPVKGIEWSLYRIGSFDGEKIILEGEFAKLPVDMSDLSASGLAASASTLKEFAFVYKYKTTDKAKSQKDGTVELKFEQAGVYLIAAPVYRDGKETYISTPAIFILDPEKELETTIYPKIKKDAVLTGEIQRYQLVKIWENDENQLLKPNEIVVDIYRDFKYYETVTLSEANNWSYSWEEENYSEWSMIERKIPEGCAVIYRENGRQYVVVNTYVPDFVFEWELNFPPPVVVEVTTTVTEETTTTSYTSTIDGGVTSESTTSTTTATTTTSTKKTTTKRTTTSKLPQTGQLWWPVPVMAGAGLVLIATGARIISGSKRDEDE